MANVSARSERANIKVHAKEGYNCIARQLVDAELIVKPHVTIGYAEQPSYTMKRPNTQTYMNRRNKRTSFTKAFAKPDANSSNPYSLNTASTYMKKPPRHGKIISTPIDLENQQA